MARKVFDSLEEWDFDDDGLADITIVTRNGEKGIYVSLRALTVVLTAVTVWISGAFEALL